MSALDGRPTTARRRWLLVLRLPLVAGLAVGTWLVMLVVRVVALIAPPLWLPARNALLRNWGRMSCFVMGVKVTIEGRPPRAGLIVSNHLSYLDVLVHCCACPAPFVAKAEIDGWPLVGRLCRSVDTIFVDRSLRRDVQRVGDLVAAAVERGDRVILFPEGTSTAGAEVAPFRPSIMAPLAAANRPVYASALTYSTPPPEPHAVFTVAWWGEMDFLPHALQMLQVRRIHARVRYDETPRLDSDRKALARELHGVVHELFEPVIDTAPPDPSAPPDPTAPPDPSGASAPVAEAQPSP